MFPPVPKMPETAESELREEVVTVRTTGAAADCTRLTTVEEPAAPLSELTTRLVVVVRPPEDERELDTVLCKDMRTDIRFESRSVS